MGVGGRKCHTKIVLILFFSVWKVLEHSLGTVVGMIACGEHHTTILTSTPWVRLHQETEEFLKLEQKEYELKGMFAKQTNHGLFKKDQDAIRLRMQQVIHPFPSCDCDPNFPNAVLFSLLLCPGEAGVGG